MATGSPSQLRFRAPRFDAGFNKLRPHSFSTCATAPTFVVTSCLERPELKARLGRRRPARTRVHLRARRRAVLAAQRAPSSRPTSNSYAAQGLGRRHQREGLKDLVALGKETLHAARLRSLPSGRARQRRREHGTEPVRPVPRRAAHARSGRRRRGTSLPGQGQSRIPAPLRARTHGAAGGRRKRRDEGPALSTRDAGVRRRRP